MLRQSVSLLLEEIEKDKIIMSNAHEQIMHMSKVIKIYEESLNYLFQNPEVVKKYKTLISWIGSIDYEKATEGV